MTIIDNMLADTIYGKTEKFTIKDISEFTQDDFPTIAKFRFVDEIIKELVFMLNIQPIDIVHNSANEAGAFVQANEAGAFVQANRTGVFKNVKVFTIKSMYPALISNYPFWNIPNFGNMVHQLILERTNLKRLAFDGDKDATGKSLAIKLFINCLYGYLIHPDSIIQSFQADNTWVARMGYNIMERVSENPCVLYIDTDMIIATEFPEELSKISYLEFYEESCSVEIQGKKKINWLD